MPGFLSRVARSKSTPRCRGSEGGCHECQHRQVQYESELSTSWDSFDLHRISATTLHLYVHIQTHAYAGMHVRKYVCMYDVCTCMHMYVYAYVYVHV